MLHVSFVSKFWYYNVSIIAGHKENVIKLKLYGVFESQNSMLKVQVLYFFQTLQATIM